MDQQPDAGHIDLDAATRAKMAARGQAPDVLLDRMLLEFLDVTDDRDRFRAIPFNHNYEKIEKRKHARVIAFGQAQPDNDQEQLFLTAAEQHPDRREEFLRLAARCRQNRAEAEAERKTTPPSAEEVRAAHEARQAELIGEAVARGLAAGASTAAPEEGAPPGARRKGA